MSDYRIELGIGLNDSQLSTVKRVLESIESQERKVEYNVDFNIKNINKLTDITREFEKIRSQINDLGTKGKSKNIVPIDTESVEKSLGDIHSSIKKLQSAFGKVDSKKGVQSLLTTVNKISTALERVSKQFEGLNKNLTNLSSKDLSLNFDFGFGKSGKDPKQTMQELRMLQKEMEEYEKFFDRYYSKKNGDKDSLSRLINTYNPRNNLYGTQLLMKMGKGSDVQQIAAYKEYIKLVKESATIGKIDLAPVEFRLAESGEFVKLRNEASETEQKLKELFSGGINAESLHRTLVEIADDLSKIKQSLTGIDSEAESPINKLIQSFNRLSESMEQFIKNASLAKNVLGDNLGGSTSIDTSAINKIEKASDDATAAVIQNEKKKQEAYKATTDTVLYHAGIVSKLNKAETNGRFYGSNRGTGYFGTGHYFVDSATKHELDNNGYYNKLPYTSVDISQYDNLFKATTDEVADRLHTFLANLTSFTQGSDNYDVSELFAQFKSVFGDTIMDVKEFGLRLDQLKAFMSNSSLDDRSDSVSTQFMKSLGYEGVDTRGTRFADTRYGTVIYDLKEESILQANITDELQKQGQMLEKINYAKGQAFDKGEDERIQGILDQQVKRKEIAEEFQNSFDTTNFKNVDADLTSAKKRLKEIDEIIYDVQYGIDNAEQEVRKFAKEMSDFGLDMSEDEIKEEIQRRTKNYGEAIDELTKEKAELQSKIPILEETYNKESQLANEAYKQAEQTVEQRHREAQQAQESANTVVQSEEKKQQAYRETADVAEQVSKVKIGNTELDALSLKDDIDEADKLSAALSKLKSIQSSIDNIEIGEIDISKGVQGIQTLERQLESLSREYNETVAEINGMGGVSATQLQSFQNDIDSTNRKIEQLQSNLREKIQTAIGTNVARDVAKAHSECDKLSNKSDELRQKLQMLDDIQIELETEKEHGDIQKLSELYTRYLSILKDVNAQLDINKRAERDAAANLKLTDDRNAFQSKIDAWLTKNSAAVKQFGSQMLDLKARAEGCDRVTLNHLEAEFKQIDRAAEVAGKKTQTFMGSLKSQFSKYSSYFSVASAFMYVEQGLRSMFEQVKLIDSAMTELKKVTDETDASYNKFLSNAASRSKELGTTIDGLVGSTADFARLGYSFEDAQGLAEVANIYAVVGDDIEGVEGATESLVSTLAAFKDELSGISDTDFAMDIIDKFNEVSNNFSISSGGIGEAMERSASSLRAANNTIDESIALITAAM